MRWITTYFPKIFELHWTPKTIKSILIYYKLSTTSNHQKTLKNFPKPNPQKRKGFSFYGILYIPLTHAQLTKKRKNTQITFKPRKEKGITFQLKKVEKKKKKTYKTEWTWEWNINLKSSTLVGSSNRARNGSDETGKRAIALGADFDTRFLNVSAAFLKLFLYPSEVYHLKAKANFAPNPQRETAKGKTKRKKENPIRGLSMRRKKEEQRTEC